MANYHKGQKIGESGSAEDQGETFFYGASEAPRVHGITGAKYDSIPRFKNQYFVAFKYSNLAVGVGIDPRDTIGITHRVKSVDAPKFDIDTETLNQYNKPRIIPLRINYSPVTVTFHDDKSNIVTNFWKQIYEFYFHNGRRTDESNYSTRDSNVVTSKLGNSQAPLGYENYGYYIGNKDMNMNLFQYMSLYLVANKVCHRIDLLNPYLQSMSHDQFSQEMSSELAQNTITWGYENVVYYGRNNIEEEALMGIIGGNPSNVFHWDKTSYDYRGDVSGEHWDPLYAQTANGESTAPEGKNPPNISYPSERTDLAQYNRTSPGSVLATAPPTGNDINFYGRSGPPGQGYRPRSGINSNKADFHRALAADAASRFLQGAAARPGINASISDVYRALASKEASYTQPADYPSIETWQDQQRKDAFAAANVDTFAAVGEFKRDPDTTGSVDDYSAFKAEPGKQTGLDKTKTECDESSPTAGTNNRPTTDKPWINPNTEEGAAVAAAEAKALAAEEAMKTSTLFTATGEPAGKRKADRLRAEADYLRKAAENNARSSQKQPGQEAKVAYTTREFPPI